LLAPITGAFSPVVAYNLVQLLSLALAGWSAFILCRHVTKRFWPALAGGYVFAFSPYMLSHILGHNSLLLVFPVPLAVWLVLLRLEGRIGRGSFAAWLALAVTAQFLLDIEILATATLFGAGALALGWYPAGFDYRTKLRQVIAPMVCSYMAAAVVLSPYLYYSFVAFGRPQWAEALSQQVVARMPNLLIPPPTTWFGQWAPLRGLCHGFCIYEVGEYIGLPALLMVISARRSCRAEKRCRPPLLLFVVAWVASLGGETRRSWRATIICRGGCRARHSLRLASSERASSAVLDCRTVRAPVGARAR
jgi:hypothetical protein